MNIQQFDSLPVNPTVSVKWLISKYLHVSETIEGKIGYLPGDEYSVSHPYVVWFGESLDLYDAMRMIAKCRAWRFLNWFEALCFDRRFPGLQFKRPLITPSLAFGPRLEAVARRPRNTWGRVLSSCVDFERLPLPPEAGFLVAAANDVDRDSLGSAIGPDTFSADALQDLPAPRY